MQALYYLKVPFIIFLLGQLINLVGALVKLRHWPGGDEILTLGSFFSSFAIIYAIVKIAIIKKPN